MTRTAIALGSNLGDRLAHLRHALGGLRSLGSLVAVSSVYETAPVGGPPQGSYLNAVAILDTVLEPAALLEELQRIERAAGRRRDERWGPRTLDLDLLLYGRRTFDGPGLTVPHRRLRERRFVLEPLVEVWPGATTPDGRAVADGLAAVADQEVTLFGAAGLLDPDASSGEAASLGFSARGGWWVVAQLVTLILALVVVWSTAGTLGGGAWVRGAGAVLVAAGGIQAGLGLLHLGVGVTPYPEPRPGGNLVHGGIYRHVRHPVYGGITLGLFGAALAGLSAPGLPAAVAGAVFFWQKAGFEERRLEARYPGYAAYRAATPSRMIPFIL